MDKLAPIVLFVYNRPWHTKQTVEALQKNELAKESELFIYSDAPKNKKAEEMVREVRGYIKNIDGFKKVTIIKREKNWGLANSIIDGITKIVNEYGKIIVLEDDLVTSHSFLKFMNKALEFYKDEKKIWHINGWNHPIDTEQLDDLYFSKFVFSWGWATWFDRWSKFEKNPKNLVKVFPKKMINQFNIDGHYRFWEQIIQNKRGKINTWAVFWYATVFMHGGLCLNNNFKLVKNTGTDGSGQNCGINYIYQNQVVKSNLWQFRFPTAIQEDFLAKNKLKDFICNNTPPFSLRIRNKFKKLIGAK